ncbi:MAG TPA: cell division topological specificity factor MinE [Methylococcaceae bacterium]|nr:cell division topological specificity factor MinE [Methylococcaceae bacterium]
MSLLDYFRTSKQSSASLAKERLQILVAHERSSRNQPSYLPQLQQEILAVIQKYVEVEDNAISINYEQDDNQEMLELNITLPENSNENSNSKPKSNSNKNSHKKKKKKKK